jgi:hypothetical protein
LPQKRGLAVQQAAMGFAFQNVSRDCSMVAFKNTDEIDEATDT